LVADYTVKATPVTKIMMQVLELSNAANGILDAMDSNDKIFNENDKNENHDFYTVVPSLCNQTSTTEFTVH
jgi:hypothetical protein